MTPKSARISVLAGALALALPMLASAQIKVGVTVASTGPAASLGIPERNTVSLLPTEIAGQKIEYIVLDDATDTTVAVKNMRKLISEDKVDVVVGTSVTPGSLAMIDVAGETQTPMISVAANARIVQPVEGARQWVFKTPQNDQLMAAALADAMVKQLLGPLQATNGNDCQPLPAVDWRLPLGGLGSGNVRFPPTTNRCCTAAWPGNGCSDRCRARPSQRCCAR